MKLLIAIFLLFSSASYANDGKIYISVGQAKSKKSLLAFPLFNQYGTKIKSNSTLATELYQTVKNDLTVVGLFQLIDPDAFLEDTSKTGLRPYPTDASGFSFKNWMPIGAEFLIRAGVKIVAGEVILETYLYYVPQAKLVFGRKYNTKKSMARELAHKFSNDVVQALTGKKAMFNSKIIVTGKKGNGPKELYLMDWDGNNKVKMTNHKNLAISPAISNDAKMIAYTSMAYHRKAKTRNADLFIKPVKGKAKLFSYKKGINSGASFHPNGSDILMTISQAGNADIYQVDLTTKKTKRLTKGPRNAMNVEPTVSPDGTTLAFSSDRSGRPMIYIMPMNSKKAKRITFAGRYNASPSWSPDGKKIAFAGFDKGHFDIFIVNKSGFNLVRLTSAKKTNGKWANNESPTFSPDGRFIMFASNRTGKKQLFIVDTEGNNERQITKDEYSYEKPKWSGHLD